MTALLNAIDALNGFAFASLVVGLGVGLAAIAWPRTTENGAALRSEKHLNKRGQ